MNPQESSRPTLESWKEIGAYLQRDGKTARRWEKEEGLPVHRHTHTSRSTVYAYPDEIDAWRRSRKTNPEPDRKPLWRIPAFALTLVLCLITVGNGIRPIQAQHLGPAKANRQIWVASLEEPSSLSSDGRYVSFTDDETGDLGVRDLKTKTNRRLTHEGKTDWVDASVISPDSRKIAYESSAEDHADVRIIPISGGNPRIIWRSEKRDESMDPVAWTPDGKQLLVLHRLADRSRELGMLILAHGSFRSLKKLGAKISAALSPDGRWIAYDSPANQTTSKDIFVVSADGTREAAIVQNPADDSMPLWSPDGSRILFQSDRTGQPSLWSVPFEDGRPGVPQLVKEGIAVTSIWIAKDGTLFYTPPQRDGKNPNIYFVELDANGKASKTPVLVIDQARFKAAPTLSPDGQYLAFATSQAGTVIHDLKTGSERAVPAPINIGPDRWFPGQRAVLGGERFQSDDSTSPKPFYRVDLASGKTEILFTAPGIIPAQDVSPDSKAIFFSERASPGRPARLVRFDIGTHRETELSKGADIVSIAISPDGKQLGYTASGYVAVIPADGGESREVFRASPWRESANRHRALAWTPDSRYLIFARRTGNGSGPEALFRVPLSGGPAEQIVPPLPGTIRFPMVQPDGRGILFAGTPVNPIEVWALENYLPKSGR